MSKKSPNLIYQIKQLFQQKITSPRTKRPVTTEDLVLDGVIAYNKYGGYLIPNSSLDRPAAAKIMRGQVYEPETIEYIRNHCGKGDVVHAGMFFGDFLPGVAGGMSPDALLWAFEPHPENYRFAEITALMNGLDKVKLHNFGLGDQATEATMTIKDEKGKQLGGASKITDPSSSFGTTAKVDVVRIDDMIPAERNVSIIQLDVEGYEKEALIGALGTIRRCLPILILEDNNDIINSDWFSSEIKSIGYEISGMLHQNTILNIKK